MTTTLFITGTDTEVGKTYVACHILRELKHRGVNACGWKPIAAGAVEVDGVLINKDALDLQKAAGTELPYEQLNPYCLRDPIAPHIAANDEVATINTSYLFDIYNKICDAYDIIIIEGAGGWEVPLNQQQCFSDWVAEHKWPVLLVVGMKLGCINHAILSANAIQQRTKLIGWHANTLPPIQNRVAENIEALEQRITPPHLSISAIVDELIRGC